MRSTHMFGRDIMFVEFAATEELGEHLLCKLTGKLQTF
jgi:hypothetical protein